jgi:hypothetical protein
LRLHISISAIFIFSLSLHITFLGELPIKVSLESLGFYHES